MQREAGKEIPEAHGLVSHARSLPPATGEQPHPRRPSRSVHTQVDNLWLWETRYTMTRDWHHAWQA